MLFRGDFLELLEENQEEKGDQSGEDFLEFRLLRRGVLVPRTGADWFGS